MANEEHLKILKQGVEAWNQWRLLNPKIEPDLSKEFIGAAYLERANLYRTNLSGAILSMAHLIEANLDLADLSQADLQVARVERASLLAANLQKANLLGTDFTTADLRKANLREARLFGARFEAANLSWADLRSTDLREAKLIEANLWEAKLDGAHVEDAIASSTIFGDVDLSLVAGLGRVRHEGPSVIGIDTIYRSKGKIPEVFLKGCGVPDNFIAYIGSLVGKAFEYYSCFISYSSKNQDFAERLHNDLQAKGVRCWFAPEDLKWGAKIRVGIDESIRKHDKLLLVLSQESVASDWVEQEVETALARERDEKRLVLFPVRLDNAAMDIHTGWPALIKNTRNIGDFRDWKDPALYQKAFDRLLRDLRAESQEP